MVLQDGHRQALLVRAGHVPGGSDPSHSEIHQNQLLLKPHCSRHNKELVPEHVLALSIPFQQALVGVNSPSRMSRDLLEAGEDCQGHQAGSAQGTLPALVNWEGEEVGGI